jgi:thioredoxin-like negative regulator of GroEL
MFGYLLLREGKPAEAIALYTDIRPDLIGTGIDRQLMRLHRETGTLHEVLDRSRKAVDAADADWSKAALVLAGRLVEDGQVESASALYRRLVDASRDETVRQEAAERLAALAP